MVTDCEPHLATLFGFSQWYISRWANFSLSFFPCGKAGGHQIRRCQGIAVDDHSLHPWRLGSVTLRLLQHWGERKTNQIMVSGDELFGANKRKIFLIYLGEA